MTDRERWRYGMLRRTGKPHVYLEGGEWLVLERTAPGEWWISLLDSSGHRRKAVAG